jgi:hypothetical protein
MDDSYSSSSSYESSIRPRSFRDDSEKPASTPEDSGSKRRPATPVARDEFNGPLVPAQFKLPQDLVQSLKLHAISGNESMSDIVLRCLTSGESIGKAWVSTRRAG